MADANIKRETDSNKNYSSLIVEYPGSVTIQLVQAGDLKFYEIFNLLFTVFLTAATGFWVGYLPLPTDNKDKTLLTISIVFTFFTILFGIFTINARRKLYKKQISKTVSKTILELK